MEAGHDGIYLLSRRPPRGFVLEFFAFGDTPV